MDPYKILGVDKKANKQQIKVAYKRKAKKKHPDVGGSDRDFEELNSAYQLLEDPLRRSYYDTYGQDKPQFNLDSQVREVIMSVIESVFKKAESQSLDLSNFDFVMEMRNCIRFVLNERNDDKRKKQKELAKYENINKRLRHKTKNESNIIGELLEFKIKRISVDLDKLDGLIDVWSNALKKLDDYSYDFANKMTVTYRIFSETNTTAGGW